MFVDEINNIVKYGHSVSKKYIILYIPSFIYVSTSYSNVSMYPTLNLILVQHNKFPCSKDKNMFKQS